MTIPGNQTIYYRLIALWVLCEAMLGGIIHGFRLPVSGLIVGSCAVICICLIAWYVPFRGAVIKATIIVAVFKMMLSPQAPPTAYIAVFFQGLLGELLFRNKNFYRLSCMLLAVLSLLESGLQRILVLTIVYGNDLWLVINDFINRLTRQTKTTNYSLMIGGFYVMMHLVTGLLVGWWASQLPAKIATWSKDKRLVIGYKEETVVTSPLISKKRKQARIGLLIVWLFLIALYTQSYFKIGTPILPSHTSLKILLRSLIIVLAWWFVIGPLLKQVLYQWMKKKQKQSQRDVEEVLRLLPVTRELLVQCWKKTSDSKGLKRIHQWSKMVLVNALTPATASNQSQVYILTAPVQTGKTTSLIHWSQSTDNVYGILTPVVNGKRVFMDVHTRDQFAMEAATGEEDVLVVGRFIFSNSTFNRASQVIKSAIDKPGWLIIDEAGPLELKEQGFYAAIKEAVQTRNGKTIIVVRAGLVEAVKDKFNVPGAKEFADIMELEKS